MSSFYIEHQRRRSAVESLKQLVIALSALTMTNGTLVLLSQGTYGTIIRPEQLTYMIEETSLFVLLIVNIVRFYHGNIRLLDDAYLIDEKHFIDTGRSNAVTRRNLLPLDFFFVFVIAFLFAILSFFTAFPQVFIAVFSIILVVDVIWFITSWSKPHDDKTVDQQKKWMLNNLILLIALFLIFSLVGPATTTSGFWFLAGAISLNTIADFYISRPLYFPFIAQSAR